ncbi:hypothetical protein HZH66_007761 [Vespula vulgaris]|uniref:Uncharacterized protein n=1 Tax=Vespula vulgaris TaxID=7454 RepID=A0A834JVT5_VESVU|nr:hypothetical protein HZH66_007761 [Vespula vulgaris]
MYFTRGKLVIKTSLLFKLAFDKERKEFNDGSGNSSSSSNSSNSSSNSSNGNGNSSSSSSSPRHFKGRTLSSAFPTNQHFLILASASGPPTSIGS